MNNVVWLSLDKEVPADDYWDMSLLKELLKDCNHHYEIGNLEVAIVVVPGQRQAKYIDEINKELSKLNQCIVVITSDEENLFPTDGLSHPNMKVFSQYYNVKYKSHIRWIPIGPAKVNNHELPTKELDWFFSGQVNNDSRNVLIKVLESLPSGVLVTTDGFAKGLSHDEYFSLIEKSRVVPSPRGIVSQDSFRFYEALEAGAIPVVLTDEFWGKTLVEVPYSHIESWNELPTVIDNNNIFTTNNVQSAWMREKLRIKYELLGEKEITVIIPCSPIVSHPSTHIIDETIASARYYLPNAKIVVTFDGVREEQTHMEYSYYEFIRRFLWKYNNKDVYPILFNDHTHQVRMLREALNHINTPLIMYIEHDTPLVTDYETPISKICEAILSGKSNLVRFHHEAKIPEEHKHMMLGAEDSSDLMRTCQWSQRPHIASKAFYRRILSDYFSDDAKSFIEDKMHGVVHQAYILDGELGWNQFRIHIYNPAGNIKRSYHTDGRAGEEKYDDKQVF